MAISGGYYGATSCGGSRNRTALRDGLVDLLQANRCARRHVCFAVVFSTKIIVQSRAQLEVNRVVPGVLLQLFVNSGNFVAFEVESVIRVNSRNIREAPPRTGLEMQIDKGANPGRASRLDDGNLQTIEFLQYGKEGLEILRQSYKRSGSGVC